MKNFFKCCIIFLFICSAITSRAQVRKDVQWNEINGVTVPLPPNVHPRLYIREDGIDELKMRLKNPEIRSSVDKLIELGVDRTPEEESKVTDRGFRYYFEMRGVTSKVQVEALDYLVTKNKKAARRAITSMLDTLKKTDFGTKQDLSRASGVMLMCGAIVYDWCYDQLTASQKQDFIKEFVRIAGTMECGYPPKNNEPIAGHSSEWMVLRDMLSCGIAIYDEYPDMYNHVITMLFKDYVPVRNFIYSGHNYHQGTGYVNVRFSNDLFFQWIMDKMGAGPVFDSSQQFVLYDFLYRRRPDGHVMPAGDVNPNSKTKPSYSLPAFLASSYYGDNYLAWEYARKPVLEPHCLIFDILWRDLDLKPQSPETLPLTRYYDRPFGWMLARTGWGDESVIAEMKVNEQFFGNHQHLDGGSFQIYYKGPLAIDSGAYQGSSGGYNSPHNKNYFKRTIAHNSLLVYDPDEKFACWNYGGGDKTEFAANDGGQRMPGDRWDTCRSFESLLSEAYTVGRTLAHGFGPDMDAPEYSYLKGDLTKAYSSKVSEVRRSFMFLNFKSEDVPAALIVYDKVVSANQDFKKFWLLHSVEEPEVKDGGFVVKRTKDGDSGMLHCDVLLPAKDNQHIEKVGGKGREFWVFGTNYPNDALPRRPDAHNERGEWRVELSPAAPAKEDLFLNVIQVADNDCTGFHKPQKIDSDKIVGVCISDRVVTFSKDADLIGGTAGFVVPGDGSKTMKFVITDLKPGNWQVLKDGAVYIPSMEVRSDDCILSFEGVSGKYELRR